MSIRVFQLFSLDGGHSKKSLDPHANVHFVAASNAREAYYYAYQETWALGPEDPTGLLEIHVKWGRFAGEHWAWCLLPAGTGVRHGDDIA